MGRHGIITEFRGGRKGADCFFGYEPPSFPQEKRLRLSAWAPSMSGLNIVHKLPSTKKRGYLAVTSLALTSNFLSSQLGRSQIQRTAVSDWVTCHRHVTLQASPLAGDGDYITKKRLSLDNLFLTGNFLSSQAVSSQVLSAFMCLTTVFGMGTGGAT